MIVSLVSSNPLIVSHISQSIDATKRGNIDTDTDGCDGDNDKEVADEEHVDR